jgi:hypothetical protein
LLDFNSNTNISGNGLRISIEVPEEQKDIVKINTIDINEMYFTLKSSNLKIEDMQPIFYTENGVLTVITQEKIDGKEQEKYWVFYKNCIVEYDEINKLKYTCDFNNQITLPKMHLKNFKVALVKNFKNNVVVLFQI